MADNEQILAEIRSAISDVSSDLDSVRRDVRDVGELVDKNLQAINILDVAIRGDNRIDGLRTRVDRLEGAKRLAVWLITSVWAAILGIMAKIVGLLNFGGG